MRWAILVAERKKAMSSVTSCRCCSIWHDVWHHLPPCLGHVPGLEPQHLPGGVVFRVFWICRHGLLHHQSQQGEKSCMLGSEQHVCAWTGLAQPKPDQRNFESPAGQIGM